MARTMKENVIADINMLVEVGALGKRNAKKVIDFVNSKAAEKTLAEYEASGCSVEDATELLTFMAGVH